MSNVGSRIKELRKSENLTQNEFAKRLLISQSYLSGIENENEIPTDKLIKLTCLEFGLNEDWLSLGNGSMYDEVYENDKVSLVETSNLALFKLMGLLSTKSNVEYGLYANTFEIFTTLLTDGQFFSEDGKLKYLELIANLIMDIERLVYVANGRVDATLLQNHREGILKDCHELCSRIEDMNKY